MKGFSYIPAIVSWVAFLPIIIIYGSNIISFEILYPLEICHQYNGNDFGTFPLCNTFPAFSYFGYLLYPPVTLFIQTLIGVIAIITYFGMIFLHNRKNPANVYKYSKWMKVLAVLLVLFDTFLSLVAVIVALIHIAGTVLYNLFKKDSPRQYNRWLIVLLVLILVLELLSLL